MVFQNTVECVGGHGFSIQSSPESLRANPTRRNALLLSSSNRVTHREILAIWEHRSITLVVRTTSPLIPCHWLLSLQTNSVGNLKPWVFNLNKGGHFVVYNARSCCCCYQEVGKLSLFSWLVNVGKVPNLYYMVKNMHSFSYINNHYRCSVHIHTCNRCPVV